MTGPPVRALWQHAFSRTERVGRVARIEQLA